MGSGETGNYEMDFSELTKIIFDRVQKVEPENVVKIMGCMLLNEPCKPEMMELAFGPESALLYKVLDAKVMLGMLSPKSSSAISFQSVYDQASSSGSRSFSCPAALHPYLDHMNSSSSYSPFSLRDSRRTPSFPEFPIKTCHYFLKGYCKHGSSCRYFHGHPFVDPNVHEFASEDSLDKLEMEITELLRSRGGAPLSIASLPTLYLEKYGRNLRADGYLTESQRHGKSGFSLTKLLARLKNSIRLIDRPHGQHAVILAEDASKYVEYRNDRSVASSHQIYLTFPAESTFAEDDVSNYFSQYGPVRDVRIPSQEKRMFGFVSFLSPETVNTILMKRNPHYICGARVLVKQYREKSNNFDRSERIRSLMYHPFQYPEMELELHSKSESSQLLKKHIFEELELERRLSELNLVRKPLDQQKYYGYGVEDLKLPEGLDVIPDHFSYTIDDLNNGSTSGERGAYTRDGYFEQESTHIDLPENPFASAQVGSSSIHVET